MSTLTRYLLLQVPGWILAALVALGLTQWGGFPGWIAGGLLLIWVMKDLILYPLVRTAYEPNVKTGVEQLLGVRGVVRKELNPRGSVQVRGELWSAESEYGATSLACGTLVRIRGVRGLTLLVTADEASAAVKKN